MPTSMPQRIPSKQVPWECISSQAVQIWLLPSTTGRRIIYPALVLCGGYYYFYPVIQEIFIGLIFLVALGYMGNLIYKSFQAKNACASGCGKCGAADLKKIEKSIS